MIALERPEQLIADGGVARSFKIHKENGSAECGREVIRVFACDIRHGARSARGREREEKCAFGLERIEPCGKGMSGAGADDNGVCWIEWAARSVSMNNGNLGPGLERDARAVCEGFVDFDSDDEAVRAHKLGEDSRVIARAATEMKDVVAGMNVEKTEMNSPKAGLAVVEALGRVENDERIFVEVASVCGFSKGLCAAGLD